MTVKNDSSSAIEMTLANMEATDSSGQDYDDVFDGSQYKGSLAFTDPVHAGGETTYELAFGVPADEVDGMHIKLTLPEDLGDGKDFECSKKREAPSGSASLPETASSARVRAGSQTAANAAGGAVA